MKTDDELFELAKKMGDNYTYGQIVKCLKELLSEQKDELKGDLK